MFLETPPIHKKLHSPESFPQTYTIKRDPAYADGVGNISEGNALRNIFYNYIL